MNLHFRVEEVEVAFCPKCGCKLEDYSRVEGGWCPEGEEWWPDDIIREHREEAEG